MLLESDINVIADRVQTVNGEAEKFTREEGPDGSGYRYVAPRILTLSKVCCF